MESVSQCILDLFRYWHSCYTLQSILSFRSAVSGENGSKQIDTQELSHITSTLFQ